MAGSNPQTFGSGSPDATVHFEAYRRRRRRRHAPPGFNLTPMIDVTFLLLIFFLVTSSFERPEGLFASRFPRRGEGPAASAPLPISPIVIRLSRDGEGYRIRVDHFTTVPVSFGDLAAFLKDVQGNPGFDAETPVVILPDNEVAWDHVVGSWNAAVRAGCTNIVFGSP